MGSTNTFAPTAPVLRSRAGADWRTDRVTTGELRAGNAVLDPAAAPGAAATARRLVVLDGNPRAVVITVRGHLMTVFEVTGQDADSGQYVSWTATLVTAWHRVRGSV
jgi:hypothetical protein